MDDVLDGLVWYSLGCALGAPSASAVLQLLLVTAGARSRWGRRGV